MVQEYGRLNDHVFLRLITTQGFLNGIVIVRVLIVKLIILLVLCSVPVNILQGLL